jgi:hypothetical protein
VGPSLGTTAIRDAAFLQWRFVDAPRPYRRWAATAGGDPVGFAVSRLVPWQGTLLAYLLELIAPDRAAAASLVNAVIEDARRDGAVALCAVDRPGLTRAGFLPVPARLVADISFGVRPFAQDVGGAVLRRDSWYLSGSDFDWL